MSRVGCSKGSALARLLWLYPGLVLPSLFIVDKVFGGTAMAAYAAGVALVVWLSMHVDSAVARRRELVIMLALLALILAVFVVLYPRLNAQVPGHGSDDDDAYNVGVRALLGAESPYTSRTYLGNVLHQLPGAFLLAAPFVLLGTSALQNLFWLPLYFGTIRREGRGGRATVLALLVLVASPVVLQQVATGTGHVANTLYVLLGLWWLMRTGRPVAVSALWGVALASRANFLFLVPVACGWLWHRHGARTAIASAAAALATVAVLTIPFYATDPAAFGPLEAADRINRFDAALPHAGSAIAVSMGILSFALAWRATTPVVVWTSCAAVQALPVIAGTLLGWFAWGYVDLAYLEYGTFAAWFAFTGWALQD